MASINFRFTTECEMTIHGTTYEEIYLQFKDFIHGDMQVSQRAHIDVFPPESVQLYFDLESAGEKHEIPYFKGDYQKDIASRCMPHELQKMPIPMRDKSAVAWKNPDDDTLYWYGS